MIEHADVVAARRKANILNERDIIDFKNIFEQLQLQIIQNIGTKIDLPEVKFSICYGKSFLSRLDNSISLSIPKMYYENKLFLFEKVEDWLVFNDYDYIPIFNSKKDLVGFTVSWKDRIDIEPFDFSEEEEEINIDE